MSAELAWALDLILGLLHLAKVDCSAPLHLLRVGPLLHRRQIILSTLWKSLVLCLYHFPLLHLYLRYRLEYRCHLSEIAFWPAPWKSCRVCLHRGMANLSWARSRLYSSQGRSNPRNLCFCFEISNRSGFYLLNLISLLPGWTFRWTCSINLMLAPAATFVLRLFHECFQLHHSVWIGGLDIEFIFIWLQEMAKFL